jgi:ribonuclease BN (tRNA processing enzyme)
MRVTILGSGTCVPRLDRSACAVLVETGQSRILLDLGPGTMRRLLRTGTSIFDLTHIFLSHLHPDHSAELAPLLFASKYPDASARTRVLHLLGGDGLKRFYKGLQGVYGEWIVLPQGQTVIREIDTLSGETLAFADFKLEARPVMHRPESLAVRISDDAGKTVAYSGDTDPCDTLAETAREADLFICEAATPDGRKVPGHMTPSLAGAIAAKARAKRLVLTHLYPECDGVDIVKQAQETYKGTVAAAEDLMCFDL